MVTNNTADRQAVSTKRLGGVMGYLNRFIGAGNTRERRVFSVFVAFILALSFAGMPLFGETAHAAQGDDAQEPVAAIAPEAADADAAEPEAGDRPEASAPFAYAETAEAPNTAAAGCDHSAWSASDSRWVIEDEVYPTCTQPGLRTKACPLCGEVVSKDQVAALGHNFEAMICVDDTEYGYCEDGCDSHGHRVICESCDGEEAGGVLDQDHNYGDWEVVRDATPGDSGLQQRLCLDCGHVQNAPAAEPVDTDPSAANPADQDSPAVPIEEPATVEPADVPEPDGSEVPGASDAVATPGEPEDPEASDDDSPASSADQADTAGALAETIEDDANPLAAQPDRGTQDADTGSADAIYGVNGLLQQLAAVPGHLAAFACEAAELLCSVCDGLDSPVSAASAFTPVGWSASPCERQLLTLQ